MGPWDQPWARVRRQGRGDAEGQQPAGQARHAQAMAGGVEDHHGGAVDQPVDGGGFEPGGGPGLPVRGDDLVGVLVADVGGDPGYRQDGGGGGYADGPVGGAHRRPLEDRDRRAADGAARRGPVTREAPPVPNGLTG